MRSKIAVAGTVATLVVGIGTDARAGLFCLDTLASTSKDDITLADNMNDCATVRDQNISVIRSDFDMNTDDWGISWGGGALANGPPCDDFNDVMKMVNAGMLMLSGINFTRGSNLILVSYHSTFFPDGDYSNLSFHGGSDWHNWFRDQVATALAPNAAADFSARSGINIGQPDLLQLGCSMFDQAPPSFLKRVSLATPEVRAEVTLHEAWHAWEHSHNNEVNTGDCGHTKCGDDGHPTKGFCRAGYECDVWQPHAMVGEGQMKTVLHRPYQVMTEFACDIVDTPQSWVPLTVRERAASDADVWGQLASVNGPGVACSTMAAGQSFPFCTVSGAVQCDQANPCKSGQFCDVQSGCCNSFYGCTVTNEKTCDGTCTCDDATGCCVGPGGTGSSGGSSSSGAGTSSGGSVGSPCFNQTTQLPDSTLCPSGQFCNGAGFCEQTPM